MPSFRKVLGFICIENCFRIKKDVCLYVSECVFVCLFVCLCVCVCVYMCVHLGARMCTCTYLQGIRQPFPCLHRMEIS